MRARMLLAGCAIGLLLAAASVALAAKPAKSAKQSTPPSPAAPVSPAQRLVAAALEAEAGGQLESRQTLLEQALDADPQFAAAHWHLGKIRVGDAWLSVDEAIKKTVAEGKIFDYNRRRNTAGRSAAEQAALARWCREQGLTEQHRIHSQLAFQADPTLVEARDEMRLCAYSDQWSAYYALDPEQSQRAAAQHEQWKTQLTSWLRLSKKSGNAKDAIRNIADPAAIPVIEQILSVESQSSALMAVEALSNMPEQAAAESLVRHAVLSPWHDVRTKAAKALSARSLYSYAPLLLAGLQAPIEVEYAAIEQGVGSWTFRCQLYRQGPMVDASLESTMRVQRSPTAVGSRQELTADPQANRELDTAEGLYRRGFVEAQANAAAAAAQVKQWNRQVAWLNARVTSALGAATAGTDADPRNRPPAKIGRSERETDPNEPRYWWEWWYDHNDIYYTSERPVTQYQDFDYQQRPTFTPIDCFIAGTPVWTPTGPIAIDLVQPGDLVLAKHPISGEVAYKGVQSVTERPPVALLRIAAGSGELVVTKGHPLWVSGQGWRMARELVVGDRLHTLTGTIEIKEIEPGPKAKAYSLAVDEFATYFVGPDRILSHDNNLRQPIDVPVPGLVSTSR